MCSVLLGTFLSQSKFKSIGYFENNDPVIEIFLDQDHSLFPLECTKYVMLSA